MNESNNSKQLLSDSALDKVMRDLLSGVWEISPERARQELAKRGQLQEEGDGESENV